MMTDHTNNLTPNIMAIPTVNGVLVFHEGVWSYQVDGVHRFYLSQYEVSLLDLSKSFTFNE